MSLIRDILVRPAREGDAPEIANVHLNSWREAYRGLLPQDFLDQLPTTFKRRLTVWQNVICQPDKEVLQVAEAKCGIVGFASLSAGRDEGLENLAELKALYLLEKFKGGGAGFSLLCSGFQGMRERGFTSAYCWVLENNPTINFYKKTGAQFWDKTKYAEIGGKSVRELAYYWNTLDLNHSAKENK